METALNNFFYSQTKWEDLLKVKRLSHEQLKTDLGKVVKYEAIVNKNSYCGNKFLYPFLN